jgi:hypothetical protein
MESTDDKVKTIVGGSNKSAKKQNGLRKGGKYKKQKPGKKTGKKSKKTVKKTLKTVATKGTKKAPSKWILHIKNFAKSRNINFGAAMKHPDCKKTYKSM